MTVELEPHTEAEDAPAAHAIADEASTVSMLPESVTITSVSDTAATGNNSQPVVIPTVSEPPNSEQIAAIDASGAASLAAYESVDELPESSTIPTSDIFYANSSVEDTHQHSDSVASVTEASPATQTGHYQPDEAVIESEATYAAASSTSLFTATVSLGQMSGNSQEPIPQQSSAAFAPAPAQAINAPQQGFDFLDEMCECVADNDPVDFAVAKALVLLAGVPVHKMIVAELFFLVGNARTARVILATLSMPGVSQWTTIPSALSVQLQAGGRSALRILGRAAVPVLIAYGGALAYVESYCATFLMASWWYGGPGYNPATDNILTTVQAKYLS